MTERPTHVPEFGNWDSKDNIPFTMVFENARAGKGGNKINDPAEHHAAVDMKSDKLAHNKHSDASGSRHRPNSKEDSNNNSPAQERNANLPNRRLSGDALGYRRPTADGSRKGSSIAGARENSGAESADQSPSHQSYQGRLGNRPGSPYWERKNPSEGGSLFAPGTPSKSRLRPGSGRPDETPDRSPALPKFGAWDEKDPSSGEGFTFIFNQARNEKKLGGPVRIPALQGESPARIENADAYKQSHNSQYRSQKKTSIWTCCFQSSAAD